MKDIKNHVMHIVQTLNEGFEGYGEENEYGDTQTAFDYLNDALDFNWILNSDRTLKGARILVAFGGPNIWIDTVKGVVEGYWCGDSFTADYDRHSEFARDLDDALETVFNC